MKTIILSATLFTAATCLPAVVYADVTLVENGTARVAIHVPPQVMATDKPVSSKTPYLENETELQRRRLRDSVKDLAQTLQKMSDAKIEVLQRAPSAADKQTPILIGEYARAKFGEPQKKSPFKQGWRMVVSPRAIGLLGENGESASYAIYEVLDRLGCRWYMPGELGEVVPRRKTVRLAETDVSDVPDTEFRNVWYADDAFKRRNRLGGFSVAAPHALESYITQEQREQHPDWRAIIDGKPHPMRLKWSNPAVSDAIADAIIAKLDQKYTPTVSLAPEDGALFDESDDKKLDAGDWDPAMNQVSITDRYINFCNRIAERVTKKYPDVRFGMLAYVQYTRSPVREKLHPNLLMKIAPITYCRAHAMTDKHVCPSRAQIRPLVESWGKVAQGRLAYYNYMFHLAEVSVPYPMMHQMSEELPILYRNGISFWGPETMPNYESVLPGMWLSLRMAWNNQLKPKEVFDDLFTNFYGSASKPMQRYWQTFDDSWTNVPAHAGSLWSYNRRFTPEILKAARTAMDEALSAAQTVTEYRRVKLFDNSLRQFERFMALRYDLNEGRLANLDLRGLEWQGTQIGLGNEYSDHYVFGKTSWSPRTIAGGYYNVFVNKTYEDAARIADRRSPYTLVSNKPLREWKYFFLAAQDNQTEQAQGWDKPEFDDSTWKSTDAAVETWADLGMMNEFGTMWYRATYRLPKLPEGKKLFLWIAAADNSARVFVNGQAIPFVDDKGETTETAKGFARPFSFDITQAAKADADNQITIASTRDFLRELGTGGLMGPVYLYREK